MSSPLTRRLVMPLAGLALVATVATACGSSGGGGGIDAFCSLAKSNQAALTGAGTNPQSALTVLDKLAAAAPDAIKADLQYIDDTLRAAIKDKKPPADQQKFQQALQHLKQYGQTNCPNLK